MDWSRFKRFGRASGFVTTILYVGLAWSLTVLGGCTTYNPKLPTAAELKEFNEAGPIRPKIDPRLLSVPMPTPDLYRVLPGDLLELYNFSPALLAIDVRPDASVSTYLVRVEENGTVSLPMIDRLAVEGKTLSQIGTMISDAYFPKFVKNRPNVAVTVKEYRTWPVSIVGAVKKPGTYELAKNRLTLVSLLMQAEGLTDEGAGVIRIRRQGETESQTLLLPVEGLSVPFRDVALKPGDVVEVQRTDPAVFAITGLVIKPGAYPYPPSTTYTVLQAVAIGGGLDPIADPKYVTIYRQTAGGKIVSVSFTLVGQESTAAAAAVIKQGDVVAVEQTAETRTKLWLAQVLRIQVGYTGQQF